jgi:hypothetical protein
MFLHIHCMWSSHIIMLGSCLHSLGLLSVYLCDMSFETDFEFLCEPDESRSSSRHPCAPNHRPGSSEHTRFRIFIITLPRSSKSWFFGKLKLKGTRVVTNIFHREISSKLFPIDRIPRGFDKISIVSRVIDLWDQPSIYIPTTVICPLRLILSSCVNQTSPDQVPGIPAHLIIAPDRLNTPDSEYSSSPCLGHQNHDFSGN